MLADFAMENDRCKLPLLQPHIMMDTARWQLDPDSYLYCIMLLFSTMFWSKFYIFSQLPESDQLYVCDWHSCRHRPLRQTGDIRAINDWWWLTGQCCQFWLWAEIGVLRWLTQWLRYWLSVFPRTAVVQKNLLQPDTELQDEICERGCRQTVSVLSGPVW